MISLVTAILTGIAAFIATNIDDLVILILFFSQVNGVLRRRHIVIGQYLGFIFLLLATLPGFFGRLIIPSDSIKILGLVPIILGLFYLLKPEENNDEEDTTFLETLESESKISKFASWLSPQTCSIAAITVANGSDNIGVYVPLFASSTWENQIIILAVFFILMGVWCYTAYKLTSITPIAELLSGYGDSFVACILIALGVFIVKESIVLTLMALTVSCLWSITLGKNNLRSSEIENLQE